MSILKKMITKFFGINEVQKQRVKNNEHNYSLSFIDTKLNWIKRPQSWINSYTNSELKGGSHRDICSVYSSINANSEAESLLMISTINLVDFSKAVVSSDIGDNENALGNLENVLQMTKYYEKYQQTVLSSGDINSIIKDVEESFSNYYINFFAEDDFINSTGQSIYHDRYLGLESFYLSKGGIDGDAWRYEMYIPAGNIIYFLKGSIFRENKDEITLNMKEEIEKIVKSFRFKIISLG